jgi:hypothetical protein
VGEKIAVSARMNSCVQKIFDLLGLREPGATMLFNQDGYLPRTALRCRPLILGPLTETWFLRVDGVYQRTDLTLQCCMSKHHSREGYGVWRDFIRVGKGHIVGTHGSASGSA